MSEDHLSLERVRVLIMTWRKDALEQKKIAREAKAKNMLVTACGEMHEAETREQCADELEALVRTLREIPDDCGLSVDMLDVDRLRDWARLLLVHGPDIGHWGSVPFVVSKMQTLATDLEKAIRDIGTLREAALSPPREARHE